MWYFTVAIVVFGTISMSGYVITIGTVVMLLYIACVKIVTQAANGAVIVVIMAVKG